APDESTASQAKARPRGTQKAEANAVAGGAPNRSLRSNDACGAMSRNRIIQSGLTELTPFTPCPVQVVLESSKIGLQQFEGALSILRVCASSFQPRNSGFLLIDKIPHVEDLLCSEQGLVEFYRHHGSISVMVL